LLAGAVARPNHNLICSTSGFLTPWVQGKQDCQKMSSTSGGSMVELTVKSPSTAWPADSIINP
jgi:hypothetical protein